jgi:putative FmdB family regulatory protein
MPMYDFECSKGHAFEEICAVNEEVKCPECGAEAKKVWRSGPPVLTHIIPSYPGCLAQKAGYVHSHAPQPSTKVQSGYGGMCNPS